ncbi:MAG: hypothetical protein IPN79_17515 [Saprospiraceae bacterium]|nr:hypothetical protein [Saprospiraceae bacterium]
MRTQGKQIENVGCQLIDKNGNLWFSIRGEGATVMMENHLSILLPKMVCATTCEGSIIEDRAGNILFGTNSGICRYDGDKLQNILCPTH